MKILFYLKLALVNIKKNMKFYIPYLGTAIFTVMMFYLFNFLADNKGIEAMGPTTAAGLRSIFSFGVIVIAVFSAIFLFYTNSFVIKRRKKELGLFNVLGMEKRHLSVLMILENFLVSFTAIVSGILLGILFSKLMLLFLYKLVKIQAEFGFEISEKGIKNSLLLFIFIFSINLIYDLIQISVSKPVNLLSGSNVGEKEPKTKWILTIIGSGCMIAGYILANTITSPLEALSIFFIAVMLVIVGTYLLFIAVSITVLKMLKKNKKFYYRADHFVSLSGMLYRMKQNAAGLASICILSTMVIVMVSTTVCMYVGADDLIRNRFPQDIMIDVIDPEDGELETIQKISAEIAEQSGQTISNLEVQNQLMLLVNENRKELMPCSSSTHNLNEAGIASVISLDTYRLFNTDFTEELSEGEVLLYAPRKSQITDNLTFLTHTYQIKECINKADFNGRNYYLNMLDMYIIVVKDNETVNAIQKEYQKMIEEQKSESEVNVGGLSNSNIYGSVNFDVSGSEENKIELYQQLNGALKTDIDIMQKDGTFITKTPDVVIASRAYSKAGFDADYGGLFFLGIFLGITFLVATVIIIYYKQITEGYDDQRRFLIMQQVGMSKEEVKSTIKSQVMLVFFLPLATAVCHIAGSFKMMEKLLNLLNLSNAGLFVLFTVFTVIGFALFYVAVYMMTAKVYYKIVNKE